DTTGEKMTDVVDDAIASDLQDICKMLNLSL
ncbi:hypothetical protein A2U01_0095867, partial [Trifolium medium]|nr:hypothetical protein [Trifolium medium]